MTSSAVHDYQTLIERNPHLLDESRDFLIERFKEVQLVFGGRTLSPYLRPHFVTPQEWVNIVAACETIWGAIETVGRIAPSNQLMLEQLRLTSGELDLVAVDPGYPSISVTSRLDSFLTEDKYSFVELNAECPAGIAYQDVAAEIFLDLPLMREFKKSHKVTPMYCRKLMLDSLLAIYQQVRGTAARPNIGVIDFRDVPTVREFQLFKEYFENNGYATTIADPRDLEMKSGKLHFRDFRIDLVYRRVLTTELLEKIGECVPFVEAYKSGAAVFVNSFRTKYVHKKMLFGILTDERHEGIFSSEQRNAIRNHVPWTRRVEDTATSRDGVDIQLLNHIRENRHDLVLKPNDDYGGHGIFIGWECDQSAWDIAIQAALSGDYLVQERVSTRREIFPFVDESEGGVRMLEQLLDIDPLLFFGKAAGSFTRLSSSSLANVTSGAGMVPTMIAE
jgi:hypothetical protein